MTQVEQIGITLYFIVSTDDSSLINLMSLSTSELKNTYRCPGPVGFKNGNLYSCTNLTITKTTTLLFYLQQQIITARKIKHSRN